SLKIVTPEYHQVFGIPLKTGRFFNASDREGGRPVVILNELAAKNFFPGADAIGRTGRIESLDRTVIGVVGNVRQWGLETNEMPELYLPMAQMRGRLGYLAIRA